MVTSLKLVFEPFKRGIRCFKRGSQSCHSGAGQCGQGGGGVDPWICDKVFLSICVKVGILQQGISG